MFTAMAADAVRFDKQNTAVTISNAAVSSATAFSWYYHRNHEMQAGRHIVSAIVLIDVLYSYSCCGLTTRMRVQKPAYIKEMVKRVYIMQDNIECSV